MNRIKFLREEKDLNQADIGKLLGITSQAVGLYENGKRDIPTKYIIELAKFFNVTVDYLLCKTDVRNAIVHIAKIPVLGTVKAGYDWLAEENIIDYITLKEELPNIKEYYALRITGDSMLPILNAGDIVIVHNQDDVESGQTAVILINGEEATVKKVVKTSEGIELHSMNPYYPVKKFTFEDMKNIPVKIIGRVRKAEIKGVFE